MIFRFSILFVFALASFSVKAQEDTINQMDDLGRKQGLWFYYGKDRPELNYPLEGKVEEGFFRDNRKDSVWIKYYQDGFTPKIMATYRNNRPEGPYKKYYPDGTLQETGNFSKGRYEGARCRWYVNGNKQYYADIDSTVYWRENGCRELLYLHDSVNLRTKTYRYSSTNCNEITDSSSMRYNPDVDYQPSERIDGVVRASVACNFGPEPSKISVRTEKFVAENPDYSDSAICNCQKVSDNRLKCYNSLNDLYFMGKCEDGVISGRIYFYDKDGILVRLEVWRNGEFKEVGSF